MSEYDSTADIAVEIDADGKDAGVELEDVGEEIRDPFDPRQIDVVTETRTLDTLMKRLEIGQIDLDPDFQRSRGIWTVKKKSQLIESLLLRIPLPTFYVAEVGADSGLGEVGWSVVDGIQRLSTIAEFVAPLTLGLEPLRLRGLEYLRNEQDKSFVELSKALQLRVLESQFTMQVIRRSTPEPVKLNIFARINTGGVPLSAQELRHTLTPGQAREVLKEFAQSEDFQQAVAKSVSGSRMTDREMVLRYLAFRLQDPIDYRNQDFDSFLRDAMKTINGWSPTVRARYADEFSLVMRTCRAIFEADAFRKRYNDEDARRPVSKALFEAVAVAVARVLDTSGTTGLQSLVKHSGEVRRRFRALMGDREFERSISQGTGDPTRVRIRFEKMIDLMSAIAEGAPP